MVLLELTKKKESHKPRSKFIINTTNQMTQKQIKIHTPMYRFISEAKALGIVQFSLHSKGKIKS